MAKLTEVVQGLTHQVRQLALILDEVREELIWAVRNDKFTCPGASDRYVATTLGSHAAEADEEPEPPAVPTKPPPRPAAKSTLFD